MVLDCVPQEKEARRQAGLFRVRGVRDHLVMNREPLRLLLLPVAALALAAAAQAFIDGADVRGVITAVLGVLVAAATELARSRVTPVP
jgi:hypothetical protein